MIDAMSKNMSVQGKDSPISAFKNKYKLTDCYHTRLN